MKIYRPLWIDIDLRALRGNFAEIKKIVGPKVKIMATLKQEAYGHGLARVACELKKAGVDFFGLGSLEEVISLREQGIKDRLLVLGSNLKETAGDFVKFNAIPTVVDLEFAKELNKKAKKAGKKIPVHIKVDTGMGRLGIWASEAIFFIEKLAKLKNIVLEGLYTHFPCADSDPKFTKKQINVFNELVKSLAYCGIKFKYLHCSNSIALLRYKQAHFNLVRPGIGLYGVIAKDKNRKFKPVLSLKSKIVFIKKVSKGCGISYGRTFVAKKDTYIATVAIGYADGYFWSLSNKSKVIINNKFFTLVGRVCMDHVMIDVGQDLKVKVGDEVILIGKSRDKEISASYLASLANTICYEMISRLPSKIPRIYINK